MSMHIDTSRTCPGCGSNQIRVIDRGNNPFLKLTCTACGHSEQSKY